MNLNTIKNISFELFKALRKQETVLPLTDRYPEIEINDAYQISRNFLSLRENDGEKIIGYRKAMVLEKQPKEMIIVGSGAIGVEFAYFYNSMGTKVTLVEYEKNIAPIEDKDISKELSKILKKSGIKILNSSKVVDSKIIGDKVEVTIEYNNKKSIINGDVVLSAVGIKSNIENLSLIHISEPTRPY